MITDGTIQLRAPEPADVDSMYIWENDPTIWSEGTLRAPMSHKMLRDFVDCYNPDPAAAGQLRLIIEEVATNKAVGCVDLYDYDSVNRRAGTGIVISASFRRHGYACRALRLLCDYCRKDLGLHQLWAIVARGNEASLAAFGKSGYVTSGSLRSWIRNGESYSDALIMQRLLVAPK